MTRHRPHPAPRSEHGRPLVTRAVIAHLAGRDERVVRRWLQPVACDIRTRALLVDLDDADREIAARTRRRKTAA